MHCSLRPSALSAWPQLIHVLALVGMAFQQILVDFDRARIFPDLIPAPPRSERGNWD